MWTCGLTNPSSPDRRRQPAGHPRRGPVVEHAQPTVRGHPVVAGVRVGVQHAHSGGAREQEPHVQQPGLVALLARARRDHVRQRTPVHPFRHDDVLRTLHDLWHRELGVAVVGHREGVLCFGLQPVVELFDQSVVQLLQDRLHVDARDHAAERATQPADLREVGTKRLACARVLHLDGHLAAVEPDRLVHLTDGRRRGRVVVEAGEQLRPVVAQVVGEHLVHGLGRHGRCSVLQLRQRRPVRGGDLFGQGGLEDAHDLAELHGPAFELAEHAEHLLGRAGLHLGGYGLGWCAAQALAEPPGGASRCAQRDGGELGGAARRVSGDIGHGPHLAPVPLGSPTGCLGSIQRPRPLGAQSRDPIRSRSPDAPRTAHGRAGRPAAPRASSPATPDACPAATPCFGEPLRRPARGPTRCWPAAPAAAPRRGPASARRGRHRCGAGRGSADSSWRRAPPGGRRPRTRHADGPTGAPPSSRPGPGRAPCRGRRQGRGRRGPLRWCSPRPPSTPARRRHRADGPRPVSRPVRRPPPAPMPGATAESEDGPPASRQPREGGRPGRPRGRRSSPSPAAAPAVEARPPTRPRRVRG
jgi:hypothetical protein